MWWRKNPSACPYNQRFWVQAPHPFITRERILATIVLQPGERILEIGRGTGYYTLDVARALQANGSLDMFDLQQEMLDDTVGERVKQEWATSSRSKATARSSRTTTRHSMACTS